MALGTKKPVHETVLLVDVESNSVGSALALLSRDDKPKLFGEVRIQLPLSYQHGSASLVPQIEKAAREALVHVAQIAARLRTNDKVSHLGDVSRAEIFFSAPWGVPNLHDGKASVHGALQRSLSEDILGYLGVDATVRTGADSAAYVIQRLLPGEPLLLCIIRGEVVELLLVGNQSSAGSGVLGYATVPTGINTVLRTLKSHGGATDAETMSILALGALQNAPRLESLDASARHFVEEFSGTAQHLLADGSAEGIFVIAPEPAGEWFARALGDDESLGEYFPRGGTVRALRAHQLGPHVAAHIDHPDIQLLMQALFVSKR